MTETSRGTRDGTGREVDRAPPTARLSWPARGVLWLLLALLALQAALGLRNELARAAEVPLAERVRAFGSEAEWRYRDVLGPDYPMLLAIREHARPDTLVLLAHDGTRDSVLSAARLLGLLFPLDVRQLDHAASESLAPPEGSADVLLVLIGGPDDPGRKLAGVGWNVLAELPRGQVLGAQAGRPSGQPSLPPGNDPRGATRMPTWRLLLLVALPLLAGALWLSGFGLRWRDQPLACTGWAWMTGCAWIGLLLLAWLLLGGSPRALGPSAWAAIGLLPPAAFALWGRRRPGRNESRVAESSVPASGRVESLLFSACLMFAVALPAVRIVASTARVVVGGDECTIWSAKAKALWEADGLNERFAVLAHREQGIWHQDYPLLNPLLQLFACGLAGRPLDFENRLPLQGFMLAAILALASALRRCARPAVAGLALVAFATSAPFTDCAGFALSDGIMAGGLLMLLEALQRRRAGGGWGWSALAATAATLLVFGKNEGQLLLLATLLASAVSGRRLGLRLLDACWLLPPLVVLAVQSVLNARYGFVNDLFADFGGGTGMLTRLAHQGPGYLLPVLIGLGETTLAGARGTALQVPAFLLLLVAFPRRMLLPREQDAVRPDRSLATRAVVVAAGGFLLIYLGTPWDLAWHMRWSLSRLVFQLLPAMTVSLAAAATWLAAGRPAVTEGRPG